MITLEDAKDWLLMIGSVLASIISAIGIITAWKNRSRLKWNASFDSDNQVVLRITNMTNRKMNLLGLFYYKDFILDKKNRETEIMIVNEVHSSINKMLQKESYNFKRKGKYINGHCITDPSIENIQLGPDSSKAFILKNNLLAENINSIFLKEATGEEWDMPTKIFREIRELLLKDKIKISAKIEDENRKPIRNKQLFIFEVIDNRPEVKFGPYGDVLNNIYKGSAYTDKKGDLVYYLYKSTLKKECKYTIGDGKKFIVLLKIIAKKKELFTFSITQDSTKKVIKLGKVKLVEIENLDNK